MMANSEIYKRRYKLRFGKKKHSLTEIAKLEGVSRQAINQTLGTTGKLITPGPKFPERNKQIIKLYRQKKTTQEISDQLKLSYDSVYKVGCRAGVVTRNSVNALLIPKGKFRCSGPCHKIKKLSEYGADRSQKSGRSRVCYGCARLRAKMANDRKKARKL